MFETDSKEADEILLAWRELTNEVVKQQRNPGNRLDGVFMALAVADEGMRRIEEKYGATALSVSPLFVATYILKHAATDGKAQELGDEVRRTLAMVSNSISEYYHPTVFRAATAVVNYAGGNRKALRRVWNEMKERNFSVDECSLVSTNVWAAYCMAGWMIGIGDQWCMKRHHS